jgi:outer membrane PBP1 activator LpoA protein
MKIDSTLHPTRRARLASSAVLAAIVLSACASTPLPPTAELQAAEQAIATADKARVADHASPELTQAREKLEAAKVAVREEKMGDARRLAEQSRADAELASAKSEEVKAQAVNDDMKKSTETLNSEMQRKTGAPQ